MNFIRAVGQPQGSNIGIGPGQPDVVTDAQSAVGLNGSIDDLERHIGSDHFYHGNFSSRHFIADRIHTVGRIQGQQAGLVDLAAGAGNVLADLAHFS